jgi:UDP-glucose 4-epimerase
MPSCPALRSRAAARRELAMSNVLVTGGTGYIGAHCCVALNDAGYHPDDIENLVNSSPAVLDRIERITGTRPPFVMGDVRDGATVSSLLDEWRPLAVMHFAGLKSVGESVRQPLDYVDVNVHGTIELLKAMDGADIRTFIFSSSATVYGAPDTAPVSEDAPKRVANPYGRSKLMAEEVLEDLAASDPLAHRPPALFQPGRCHQSGMIGENPVGTPNN